MSCGLKPPGPTSEKTTFRDSSSDDSGNCTVRSHPPLSFKPPGLSVLERPRSPGNHRDSQKAKTICWSKTAVSAWMPHPRRYYRSKGTCRAY
jgi:hypothetical protein